MKSRTFYSAVAFLSAVFVVLGGLGFWWLTAQNPSTLMTRGGQSDPAAAQFVPRQSPLMVSLLARPDEVWQLRQLLTPANQRFNARKEWQALKTTMENLVGWDYDKDVRPWLGQEVTLAVTAPDLDYDSANGLQPGYLVVLSSHDGKRAREALHLLWQQRAAAGQNLIFDTVSGVPLIYDEAANSPGQRISSGTMAILSSPLRTLATAMVGDRYILMGNSPQVLKTAIATFQAPDVSLAKASTYRESLKSLPANRIGWLYAKGSPLMTWLGLESQSDDQSISDFDGKRADTLFVSFRALSQGIIGDATLIPAPGTSFPVTESPAQTTTQLLELLPADTLFAIAGTHLEHLLETVSNNIGGYSLSEQASAAFLKALALPVTDIPPELLAAISGDYALGILPAQPNSWVLLAQTPDAQAFAPVDSQIQQQGMTVSHIQLGNQDVTAWTKLALSRTATDRTIDLSTKVMGLHTYLNGYEVISNSLAGLQTVLQQQGNTNSLLQHPPLLTLLTPLTQPGDTFAYGNWAQLAPKLRQEFPWLRVLENAGQPVTSHLGAFLISGYNSTPTHQDGAIALQFLDNT